MGVLEGVTRAEVFEEKELWISKGSSIGRGQGLSGSLHSCPPAIPTPGGMWSESWWRQTLAPVTRQKGENGATDTTYASPNQVPVACLLLSCRTQAKVVLFCLQGEPRTGKVERKCSQRLMIPGQQDLPLQQRPAPCLGSAMSRKGPRVTKGLDPRSCSSRRGKTSCTRGGLGEDSRHWGGGGDCRTYSRVTCLLSAFQP